MLSFLLFAPTLRADSVCVDTVAELVAAIQSFENQADGTSRVVQVVQGTYVVGGQLGGIYTSYPNSVTFSIKGGYTAGCSSRVINPANTIIDSNNAGGSALAFGVYSDANFFVEGITWTRMAGNGGPAFRIGIDSDTSDVARFTIKHCRFTQSSGTSIVELSGPEMRFINNLVADNLPGAAGGAAVQLRYAFNADSGAIVTNNTFSTNAVGGLAIQSYPGTPSVRFSEITNNIFWNHAVDLRLAGFDALINTLFVEGNVYGSSNGFFTEGASNLHSNPQFVNAGTGNYRLSLTSPAVNSGFLFQSLGFVSKDLDGDERITGTRIDRGAYESSLDDRTSFVVTNVGDNGDNNAPLAGSLRAAIKAANAAPGPFWITFEISGACPRIINMTTTMLDIVGDVTIDARTQNGWSPNTFYGRSDANLCIVLNGSGFTPHAFRVPALAGSDARLAAHGMMFAGFTDAAIRLENGHDHRISGNQFGAVPFTASNASAVRVTGASGTAYIGGFDDPASMNMIAGGSVSGIYLDNTSGGNVVANNIIGYQADGTSAGSNAIGVFIFNSPNNHLLYNFIGYNDSTGVTISGAASQGNELLYNGIGVDWLNGTPGNTGAGVAIVFGARNNIVGASLLGEYGGNYIARNTGPGVWVSPSGGAGNRVLANAFFDNGQVEIDLGTAGPTANQATNPGTGPNRQQNYPILTLAQRNTGSNQQLTVAGTLHSAPNTAYRIDVYLGRCDPSAPGRGSADYWAGRVNALSNAVGDLQFNAVFDIPSGLSTNLNVASATATSSSGDTSELGECFNVTTGALPAGIFANGFE
jgi:hypothetical protein